MERVRFDDFLFMYLKAIDILLGKLSNRLRKMVVFLRSQWAVYVELKRSWWDEMFARALEMERSVTVYASSRILY